MSVSVIIPTLNAGDALGRLLDALDAQTAKPDEILIVDSSSTDGAPQRAAGRERVRVETIERAAFDHGGTRDWALRRTAGEFVIFMTQDALPADARSVECLIAPFADERVAAVGGRQIAREHARPAEKLMRENSYPKESRVWDAGDIPRLGMRAFLISDVFAAYRRSAYVQAGGFDHPIMTDEDVLMAERLLREGFALCYCGEAAVVHSHDFTCAQQFKRNYRIGRVFRRYAARLQNASEMGEGVKLFRAIAGRLLADGHPLACARFAGDCAARLLGNRLGRLAEARAMRRAGSGQ